MGPTVGCEGAGDGSGPGEQSVEQTEQQLVSRNTFTAALTVEQGRWHNFGPFPVENRHFEVILSPDTKDQDLYFSRGGRPNQGVWDCRPYLPGSFAESCSVDGYTGDVYFSVYGYQGGRYRLSVINGADERRRLVLPEEYVAEGDWNYYGPFALDSLDVAKITPLAGDPDLYVNALGPPTSRVFNDVWPTTTGNYGCRPWLSGTALELCQVRVPLLTQKDVLVGVRGYSGYSIYELFITCWPQGMFM